MEWTHLEKCGQIGKAMEWYRNILNDIEGCGMRWVKNVEFWYSIWGIFGWKLFPRWIEWCEFVIGNEWGYFLNEENVLPRWKLLARPIHPHRAGSDVTTVQRQPHISALPAFPLRRLSNLYKTPFWDNEKPEEITAWVSTCVCVLHFINLCRKDLPLRSLSQFFVRFH